MMRVMHRRPDGSFVIERNGYPYHVTADDPLFAEVAAEADGLDLLPEPAPPAVPAPAQPTRAELMARLAELQAQIQALPA